MKLVETIPLPDEAHLIEWLDDLMEQRDLERRYPVAKYHIETNLETRTILIYLKDESEWQKPLLPRNVRRFISGLKRIARAIKSAIKRVQTR